MTTELSCEWNELVIVAKHEGKISVFSAWKRELAAWFSPERWEDPAQWPARQGLVRMPEGTPWAPQAYGIVAFDFDARACWSFNDYMVPGSASFLGKERGKPVSHYLNPNHRLDADPFEHDLQGVAWAQMLRHPQAWDQVAIQGCPAPGLLNVLTHVIGGRALKSKNRTWTLREHLGPQGETAAPEQLDARLTTSRGSLNIGGDETLVFKVAYHPQDWKTFRDHDFASTLDGWLRLADTLKDWDGFDHGAWREHLQGVLRDYLTLDTAPPSWTKLAEAVEKASQEDPELADLPARLRELDTPRGRATPKP